MSCELPKGTKQTRVLSPCLQILDSWKRLYSNSPASKFREVCIAGLWNGADVPNSPNQEHFEGFDPEVRIVICAKQSQ